MIATSLLADVHLFYMQSANNDPACSVVDEMADPSLRFGLSARLSDKSSQVRGFVA